MQTRLNHVVFLLFFICASAFAGEPELYRLDAAHSVFGFSVKYLLLVNAEGRFNDVSAAILFDSTDATKTSLTAVIKAASINTGHEGRDEDLRGEDFFEVEKFPSIIIQTKRIEKQENQYIAHCTFTMHGVAKEISVPFTYLGMQTDRHGNKRIAFEAKTTLNRMDYGIKGSEMSVDKDVHVNISILGFKPNLDSMRVTARGKKSIGDLMLSTINSKGLDAALEQYKDLKDVHPDTTYDFGVEQLNILSLKLTERGKTKEAIDVAKLNATANPQASQAYFRLGYVYQKDGQKKKAKEAYMKALELDPFNAMAHEMMRWVE